MLKRVFRRSRRRPSPGELELPAPVRAALEQVFGSAVNHVRVVEHSRNWLFWIPWVVATTRRNRIMLRGAGGDFLESPELVLEEFYHVLRQWQPGHLTRTRYLLESVRHGYAGNPFELEAKRFAREHAPRYLACCAQFTAIPPPSGR